MNCRERCVIKAAHASIVIDMAYDIPWRWELGEVEEPGRPGGRICSSSSSNLVYPGFKDNPRVFVANIFVYAGKSIVVSLNIGLVNVIHNVWIALSLLVYSRMPDFVSNQFVMPLKLCV